MLEKDTLSFATLGESIDFLSTIKHTLNAYLKQRYYVENRKYPRKYRGDKKYINRKSGGGCSAPSCSSLISDEIFETLSLKEKEFLIKFEALYNIQTERIDDRKKYQHLDIPNKIEIPNKISTPFQISTAKTVPEKENENFIWKGTKEQLEIFHRKLIEKEYISGIDFDDFESHFLLGDEADYRKKTTIKKKIKWEGSETELSYLINLLSTENNFIERDRIWETTAYIFYNKKSKILKPKNLSVSAVNGSPQQISKLLNIVNAIKSLNNFCCN